MAKSSYKPRPAGTLKDAANELIQACGGLRRSADNARVGTNTLFTYTDPGEDNAGRFMPIDIVRELERVAGAPIVTRFLAAEAGFGLLDLSPATTFENWHLALKELLREQGEDVSALLDAMAGDDITPDEAGALVKELDETVNVIADIRAQLTNIRDGKEPISND